MLALVQYVRKLLHGRRILMVSKNREALSFEKPCRVQNIRNDDFTIVETLYKVTRQAEVLNYEHENIVEDRKSI